MVEKKEKVYNWKISVKKAFYGFLMAGIPAGVYGMLPVLNELQTIVEPDKAVMIGFIVAILTFAANYMKNKN